VRGTGKQTPKYLAHPQILGPDQEAELEPAELFGDRPRQRREGPLAPAGAGAVTAPGPRPRRPPPPPSAAGTASGPWSPSGCRSYHQARPHQGLGQRPPDPPEVYPQPEAPPNPIVRIDRLGGLIHEYARAA
jgi:hypothetical protein